MVQLVLNETLERHGIRCMAQCRYSMMACASNAQSSTHCVTDRCILGASDVTQVKEGEVEKKRHVSA